MDGSGREKMGFSPHAADLSSSSTFAISFVGASM
jgi:hypothetical protein